MKLLELIKQRTIEEAERIGREGGIGQGAGQGVEQGVELNLKKIIRQMLAKGFSKEQIADILEIDEILTITKACATFMIKNGIFQWNEHYPSKQAFENDIARNELYVLEIDKKIIGAVVISTHMDDEYIPINWLTANEKNIYCRRRHWWAYKCCTQYG